MSESCAVSVIVPVCNVQKYLRECLNSLSRQTLQSIQFICIDDGSTDNSLAILQEYAKNDPRFVVISKPNSGYGNTMNRGLDAAIGEYIGIVESDDFAEDDMFESLYRLARLHELDVIKSNFFTHASNTDPNDDPILENLERCTFGTVFSPLEHQEIFLVQPAIWSGLYKKSFLAEKGIRFLETPGASFQDTSFNFKVFAAAERAYLTQEAYLHYRIDNSSSSVKNLSKVFCIQDEYREIWSYAKSSEQIFNSLKQRIPQIQFGGYMWNSDRLSASIRPQFYKTFYEEFSDFEQQGLLSQEFFDESAWSDLQVMMKSPDEFYQKRYGSKNITDTLIILIENLTGIGLKAITPALKSIPETTEVFIWTKRDSDTATRRILRTVGAAPNLFLTSEIFTSETAQEICVETARGENLTVISISDFASAAEWEKLASVISGTTAVNSNGFIAASLSKSTVETLDIPLWCTLLLSEFYGDNRISEFEIPEWFPHFIATNFTGSTFEEIDTSVDEGKCIAKDYQQAVSSFGKLYSSAMQRSSSMSDMEHITKQFNKLWKPLRNAFSLLPFEVRMEIGKRPSPSQLPSVVQDAPQGNGVPSISVIIPVYNSSRHILECLDSIQNQTIANLEIICVDDGSTDDSAALIRQRASADSRIRMCSQLNGGAGSARNLATSIAKGEYFAFIDSDDYYPDSDVLEKLLVAAKDNNAKICGGSFSTAENGKWKDRFGGDEAFYTFRTSGFRRFSDNATDYGWIRYIYHRSIFSDDGIKFPELTWYEDPVFLCDVMEKHREFYAIEDVVYTYRFDLEKNEWPAYKVRDLLTGVQHNLEFASSDAEFDRLYSTIVRKLDWDYCEAISKSINDTEVLTKICAIQAKLDPSKVSVVVDQNARTLLLRPLGIGVVKPDTAVVRAAKKAQDSTAYVKLQDVFKKLRQRRK